MNDLIAQKPLVQAYVVDQVRDKMIGEEAAVGVIYSGEILYVQGELEGTDVDVEYVIPEEGTNLWMDGWVIPKMQPILHLQKNGSTSSAARTSQQKISNTSPTPPRTRVPKSCSMPPTSKTRPFSRTQKPFSRTPSSTTTWARRSTGNTTTAGRP